MKANELMIGDWVRNALLNEVFKMNTTSMRNMCWDEDNGMARYTIEPIPLTEEILSSNHFLEDTWESGNEFIREFVYGSFRIRCSYGSFFVHCGNIKIYVLFVHELQHILRLCGLNDLADNFKVEDKK